mmetsp:Transcript_7115/g.12259  ORF Transcript_7115/g.12259 Transcript_7115/m.12259 type:complete len:249 (+) Transcript_7115:74-820(+)
MDESEAKMIAGELGLELGGHGTAFASERFKNKGLYAYISGRYAGMAFFGRGGTAAEQREPCSNSIMYRPAPASEAPLTEEDARAVAQAFGLALGGNGTPFASHFACKGLYTYKSGRYAGMAFFGTGGSAGQMQAPPLSGATFRPTLSRTAVADSADPSAAQERKIWAAFDSMDMDSNGRLSYQEMKALLINLGKSSSGWDPSEAQLQTLWRYADQDGNGYLDKDEFLEFILHGKRLPKQGTPDLFGKV